MDMGVGNLTTFNYLNIEGNVLKALLCPFIYQDTHTPSTLHLCNPVSFMSGMKGTYET